MSNKSKDTKYNIEFDQISYLHPNFSNASRYEMAQMVETIARSNKNISDILFTSQTESVKGGFIAEEFHTETFNLDAILNNDTSRAYTDRYDEWYSLEWKGNKLCKNDIPDIAICNDGKVNSTVQSKYYQSAEDTTASMSQIKEGTIKYEKVDTLLGPSDQVNRSFKQVPGSNEPVETTTISEHAEAKAEALQASGGDETTINAFRQTARKNSDRITNGKSSSSILSKDEADNLGSGDRSKLKQIESDYQTKSTFKQMGNAAAGAAAMSAVVSGSINTLKYIQLANEGKISAQEATLKILGETIVSAADSAVKASANVGAHSLLIRYGSEKAALQVLAKQGLNNMIKTNAVTVGVVCAIEAVKDLVRLGTGQITSQEFFDRQGKGLLTTSAGVAGGTLGVSAGVGLATTIGVSSGTVAMTMVELIGGLSGGLIAGLAMTLAVENGVGKPYRDLVNNTSALKETTRGLEQVSRNMAQGQALYTRFIEQNLQEENIFQNQLNRIDLAGQEALDIISKI